MVGNQVTDLLREVKYQLEGKGTTYFEPLHIQYLPIRNEFVEIIQTQVTETDGRLTQFGKGHTIVTLHFKKVLRRLEPRKTTIKDALSRDLTNSCQPGRISPESSQSFQDSFTASFAIARKLMASGVECHFFTGCSRQYVRFGDQRSARPRPPNHS